MEPVAILFTLTVGLLLTAAALVEDRGDPESERPAERLDAAQRIEAEVLSAAAAALLAGTRPLPRRPGLVALDHRAIGRRSE